MKPAQLDVLLDRLCAEDRFTRLDPPREEPTYLDDNIHRLSVVEDDGAIRERLFVEDVTWWKAVAIRAEDQFGKLIEDPFGADDGWDWEGFVEPAPTEPDTSANLSDSGAGEPE